MKDAVRITAVSTGIALFLAIIINLFSGSDFGTVFVRSLVTSLVWGGATFGILQLVNAFLPELLASSDQASEDDEAGIETSGETAEGGNVNIVLPEDNPYTGSEEAVMQKSNTEDADSSDIIEEVREQVHPVSYTSDTFSQEDVVETIGGDIDSLPDMSWSGDFGGPVNGSSADTASSPVNGEGSSSSSTTGPNGEDPAYIAQAISTVLKRSEQG